MSQATAQPATLRKDWVRPKPPKGYRLIVCRDVDEYHLQFFKESENHAIDVIDSWPFMENTVHDSDWKRLGIPVWL